jgi:protein arginine kinase activator
MLCNVCGKNEATIHLTEIINNQMLELHMCEQCAQEKGADFKSHLSFSDLLSGLSDFPFLFEEKKKKAALKCSNCGLTYDEFAKVGRLGCPACYKNFSRALTPLIKRVQRSTQHIGKTTLGTGAKVKANMQLKELYEKLKKCVQLEEFEEAAKIRDKIKTFESKKKRTKRGSK